MVKDNISNAKQYYGLSERFEKALKALQQLTAENYPKDRVYVDGDDVFFWVSPVDTNPPDDEMYEAHIKYADIQYVISGEEYMGWELKQNLECREACKPGEDIEWYRGNGTMLRFGEGDFAIFFPDDAHMPCRNNGKDPCKSLKAVAKVRI